MAVSHSCQISYHMKNYASNLILFLSLFMQNLNNDALSHCCWEWRESCELFIGRLQKCARFFIIHFTFPSGINLSMEIRCSMWSPMLFILIFREMKCRWCWKKHFSRARRFGIRIEKSCILNWYRRAKFGFSGGAANSSEQLRTGQKHMCTSCKPMIRKPLSF